MEESKDGRRSFDRTCVEIESQAAKGDNLDSSVAYEHSPRVTFCSKLLGAM